jgi:Tfp pilus assembly protein PilF
MKTRISLFIAPYSILLIISAILIVYGQVLWHSLGKLDEYNIILVNLDLLKDFRNLKEALLSNPFFNKGGDFYRPLQNLSFMIDAHLSGGKGWGYYLTNIMLHGVTCSLLWYLLVLVKSDRKVALLLALTYAVHPLFVQTVAWAPSRGDMLLAVFGLTSFISFIRFAEERNYLFLVIHLIAYGCALFSKESAILVPVVCFLWYALFPDERRIPVAGHIIAGIGYVAMIGFFFYLRNEVVGISVKEGQIGVVALFNHLRTIPELIFKFFIPVGLSPMPGFTWMLTGAGILLIGALVIVSVRIKPVSPKTFLFGTVWFLLFIGPSLLFINKYGSNAFDYMEHRAYFPLAGVLVFFSLWMTSHVNDRKFRNLIIYLSVVVAIFGIYAHAYARNYKDPVSFFSLAVKTNPTSAVAWYCRGTVLIVDRNDFRQALPDLDRALMLDPVYGQAYLNRGYCKEQLGNIAGAIRDYRSAAQSDPNTYEPHAALALLYSSKGMTHEAIIEFDTSLIMNPLFVTGFYQRAMLRTDMGDYSGALQDFDRTITLEPGNQEAFINRGVLKFRMQKFDFALEDLDQAIRMNDRSAEAWLNRGRVYFYLGNNDKARSDWEASARLGNSEANTLLKEFFKAP